jgi:hypothetical protein
VHSYKGFWHGLLPGGDPMVTHRLPSACMRAMLTAARPWLGRHFRSALKQSAFRVIPTIGNRVLIFPLSILPGPGCRSGSDAPQRLWHARRQGDH